VRHKHKLSASLIILFGLALGVLLVFLIIDIHDDRQRSIEVYGPVRVFDHENPPESLRDYRGLMHILEPGEQVQVRRIRNGNENGSIYESIHIRLHDGREGYIFCCDNFRLQ